MKPFVKISSKNTPSGCHCFPKGANIEFSLVVSDANCERAWFYIGNDERVLMERELKVENTTYGSACKIELNTYDICESDGLFFCHFEVISGGKRYYTAFNGYSCKLEEHFVNETQVLVYNEKYASPEWLVGGVMYQIFPDRFARGGNVTRREDAVYDDDWDNGIPEYPQNVGEAFPNNKHFGGTLYGVVKKLDYLASLGVNCIYLNPIFEAYSNHKYDTADFLSVDKSFGGDEALKTLVDKAHEHGMAVILDGVFNHVGDDSIYFDAYHKFGTGACSDYNSKYREWFIFRDYPNEYESWWGIRNLPKINRCESYIRFITEEVIPKYMQMGVDGWRLDVVDELEGSFLERITKAIKSFKKDAIIIGEVWEDASCKIAYDQRKRYFRGRQLDSVTNYPIRNAIIEFVKYGNSEFLVNTIQTLYKNYPPYKLATVMNFLGSHDTERITTVLGGDDDMGEPNEVLAHKRLSAEARAKTKELLHQAYLLLASLPGVPCIFYGDEIAMEGYHDPFNRRPFPTSGFDDDFSDLFKKINHLRAKEELFKSKELTATEEKSGVVRLTRVNGKQKLIVLANMSDNDCVCKIGKAINLLTDEKIDGSVKLPSKKVMLFKA